MAVEHLKSTVVTNLDATPPVRNNPALGAAMLRAVAGTIESTAASSVGSTYRLVRIPSNAIVHRVIYAADAAGATGQVDVGIYQTAENGGAVVDADHFASALDPGGGAIAPTDVTHESGVYNIAECNQPLWQALGLSADSNRDYDVALTVTEILADAGTHTVKVEFAI